MYSKKQLRDMEKKAEAFNKFIVDTLRKHPDVKFSMHMEVRKPIEERTNDDVYIFQFWSTADITVGYEAHYTQQQWVADMTLEELKCMFMTGIYCVKGEIAQKIGIASKLSKYI